MQVLEMECFGGPNDGVKVLVPAEGDSIYIESERGDGTTYWAIYALEVTVGGRFRLRFIGSQDGD